MFTFVEVPQPRPEHGLLQTKPLVLLQLRVHFVFVPVVHGSPSAHGSPQVVPPTQHSALVHVSLPPQSQRNVGFVSSGSHVGLFVGQVTPLHWLWQVYPAGIAQLRVQTPVVPHGLGEHGSSHALPMQHSPPAVLQVAPPHEQLPVVGSHVGAAGLVQVLPVHFGVQVWPLATVQLRTHVPVFPQEPLFKQGSAQPVPLPKQHSSPVH